MTGRGTPLSRPAKALGCDTRLREAPRSLSLHRLASPHRCEQQGTHAASAAAAIPAEHVAQGAARLALHSTSEGWGYILCLGVALGPSGHPHHGQVREKSEGCCLGIALSRRMSRSASSIEV